MLFGICDNLIFKKQKYLQFEKKDNIYIFICPTSPIQIFFYSRVHVQKNKTLYKEQI